MSAAFIASLYFIKTDLTMRQEHQDMIAATKRWLERAVIGLNLCPFAKAVHVKQQIRYVLCVARDAQTLLAELLEELQLLYDAEPETIETTLIIVPNMLQDFLDYNDFLDHAEHAVGELSLDGEVQIASFHPHYQFAGTSPNAMENYSNRAPYPIFHLLRESSVARAVAAFPDAASIYQRNIATLNKLGREGWQALWKATPDS
jgi:uncharacterized protein